MPSSPLQRAIARGLKPDGNLSKELRQLDDEPLRSTEDAAAICEALKALPEQSGTVAVPSALGLLAGMFQLIEDTDDPAFEVMSTEGVSQLVRIYDAMLASDDEHDVSDLLYVLKVLAMYGSEEGLERIIQAARRPLGSGEYLWSPLLSVYSTEHPHRDQLLEALSEPLPAGFIAVALLDLANRAALDGELQSHPFDSPAGSKQLRTWLSEFDPETVTYARSATTALPFLSNPPRDELLGLAMEYGDANIQLEAAWAAAKLGREAGLKVLARYCLDVDHSSVAQQYLEELDREDLVPAAALEPDFEAMAEFSHWLAHPNELGRPPDEMEIIDRRELVWPVDDETRPFWVIKYRLRDTTGLEEDDVDCGLVGSITWCFFTYKMNQRPPEDVYAIHCYWELQHDDLIQETEVVEPSEYEQLLQQWQGEPLQSATVTHIAEISPKLSTPARIVALASAEIDGQPGSVVLDGTRSAWYPAADQPTETPTGAPLMIHVGRQLLNFESQPDRKQFLIAETSAPSPQEVIAAYEELMAKLFESGSKTSRDNDECQPLLEQHLAAYAEAKANIGGRKHDEVLAEVYERFLAWAGEADETSRNMAYDTFGILGGDNFIAYVDVLAASGRQSEVTKLVKILAPHWEHNLGYSMLGAASLTAGDLQTGERFLLRFREEMADAHRHEEMATLAAIWHDRGDVNQARELLIDCLNKTATEFNESEYPSDREKFRKVFGHHRDAYLQLFPQGQEELASAGIPVQLG